VRRDAPHLLAWVVAVRPASNIPTTVARRTRHSATNYLCGALTRLDDMVVRLIGLRTDVDDPDRLVRFTLGDDRGLTNLALEKKLNHLLSAGNEAMRLSRKQFWDSVSEGRGSGARGVVGNKRGFVIICWRTSRGVGLVFAKASGPDQIRIGHRSPARLPPA
jgi:hypothetical protein